MISIGLGLILASLFVPFGENDAGCYDHCADAHRYFVWHPFDNLFGPVFLTIGIVAMVATCWGRPRTQPRRWAAALSGWFGVFVTLVASPVAIEETLYGAPSFEPRGGGVLVSVGFGLLFQAAAPVLFGLCPRRPVARST